MTNPIARNATTSNPRAKALRRVPGVLLLSMCGGLIAACSAGQGSPSGSSDRSTSITPLDRPTVPSTLAPATSEVPDAVPATGEPWIVYQEFTGRREEIFIVRPDGSDAHSIAADLPGRDQTNPDWSPDGERVVFGVTDSGGRDDIWIVNADGTGAAVLVDCEDACVFLDDPSWSPDGTSVVYSHVTETPDARVGTLELHHLADGTDDVLLAADPTDFFAGARWSPDGRSIVVEVVDTTDPALGSDPVGVTLSVVDLDTDPPAVLPLTEPDLFAATADWSPTGDTIVYSALATPDADAPDLFTIHPDGSGLTQLTELVAAGGSAAHPSYSPDVGRILFVAKLEPGTGYVMASVSTDGGDLASATGDSYRQGSHPRPRPGS
jgi:hypothetical protein